MCVSRSEIQKDYKIRSKIKREGITVFYCYKTNCPNYFVSHDLWVRDSGRAQLGSFFLPCIMSYEVICQICWWTG